jgi:hypothetical protein
MMMYPLFILMMRKTTDLTILEIRKVRPKLKEEADWLVFTREVLLMLKKPNTLTTSQFINLSHFHIPMTMLLLNKTKIIL